MGRNREKAEIAWQDMLNHPKTCQTCKNRDFCGEYAQKQLEADKAERIAREFTD